MTGKAAVTELVPNVFITAPSSTIPVATARPFPWGESRPRSALDSCTAPVMLCLRTLP
jgi:hypothetical protein